jgi:hypothetical protein
MEDFVIRDRGSMLIRYLFGILIMVSGITWGVLFIDNRKPVSLILLVLFTGLGLVMLAGIYRPERAVISKVDGGISILWMNWLRRRRIYDVLIEKIRLERNMVLISMYSGKSVKLRIESLGSRQKRKIYTFFINYSSANGIKVVSEF